MKLRKKWKELKLDEYKFGYEDTPISEPHYDPYRGASRMARLGKRVRELRASKPLHRAITNVRDVLRRHM